MIEQIIYGIITGVTYALAGWQKNVQTNKKIFNDEKFKWNKLIKSILVCSIVGGISGYIQSDFNILIIGSMGIGVTKAVDLIYKLFKEKVTIFLKKEKM